MLLLNEDEKGKKSSFPNILLISVTLDVSHDDTWPLKEVAPANMECIFRTLDVFHEDTSPLNEEAP